MQVTTLENQRHSNTEEVPVSLTTQRVRVEYTNMEDFLVDYTSNNTIGGMFIKTDRPLGTRVRFTLHLQIPGGRAPMVTQAEVRWTLPVDVAAPMTPGMGVRFEALAKSDRDYVEGLIAAWR